MTELHSIESTLLPLGFNKARITCLAAYLVAPMGWQSICLTNIAPIFPTEAKPASAYKRLKRFLKDSYLTWISSWDFWCCFAASSAPGHYALYARLG